MNSFISILLHRIRQGIATKPLRLLFSGLKERKRKPGACPGCDESEACRTVAQVKAELENTGKMLKTEIAKKFGRSFQIREVDTGSCGACESEIISTTNPLYDIQRFGVDFVASPRHADALLVTGPVSKNMAVALKKTYDAMPPPKFVITLGDCGKDGGPFKGSYYVENGAGSVVPVSAHIPGCPPTPSAIIKALLELIRSK